MRKLAEIVSKYKFVVIVLIIGSTIVLGYGVTKVHFTPNMLSSLQQCSLVSFFTRIDDEHSKNSGLRTSIESERGVYSSAMAGRGLTAFGGGIALLFAIISFPALLVLFPVAIKTLTPPSRYENHPPCHVLESLKTRHCST